MSKEYELGSIITMKKKHPCGSNEWRVIRLGIDIKIKCTTCGRIVIMPRVEFNRKMKKVLK